MVESTKFLLVQPNIFLSVHVLWNYNTESCKYSSEYRNISELFAPYESLETNWLLLLHYKIALRRAVYKELSSPKYLWIVCSLCIDGKYTDIFDCWSSIAFYTFTIYKWEQHDKIQFYFTLTHEGQTIHISLGDERFVYSST